MSINSIISGLFFLYLTDFKLYYDFLSKFVFLLGCSEVVIGSLVIVSVFFLGKKINKKS